MSGVSVPKPRFRAYARQDCTRFNELAGGSKRPSLLMALHPRIFPVVLIRLSARLYAAGLSRTAALIALMNMLLFRVEVPSRAEIGPGLVLPHPGGQVFGAAKIGSNVTIFQNVTIGARVFENQYDLTTRPVIEDGVTIGANAVVLGPVTIGEGATVAANSLVVEDVPARTTVIGVPAKPSGNQSS